MDDDVLLHDPSVVVAPCDEYGVLAAPLAEALEDHRESVTVAEPLLVDARQLFHFVVHAAEIDRLDIGLKLLGGVKILIQPYSADLDDLTGQMDREMVENGSVGIHSLVPFQVKDNV